MNCPSCRRFTPPGVSRCPACGTVYGGPGAASPPPRAQTPQPAAPQPSSRPSAGLRSAVAAALVNYLATKTQQAVQGYQAPAAPAGPSAAGSAAATAAQPVQLADSQV